MKTENIEQKTQYILNEDGNLIEILKTDAVPVEHPIKYKLMNAFEVFVRVRRTQNYWISNYGRCVNNLNHKDKNTFFEHKQGKVHYTVFEEEFRDLKAGKITLESLKLEQEYIEYENKASRVAYSVYNGIKTRCNNTKKRNNVSACYDDAIMCQEWLDKHMSGTLWKRVSWKSGKLVLKL